jgi:hypothetical protein
LIALAAAFVIHKIVSMSKTRKIRALFEDPRYHKALEAIGARAKELSSTEAETDQEVSFDEVLEAGVAHLTGEGVPEIEARANLVTMMGIIRQMQQQAAAQGEVT